MRKYKYLLWDVDGTIIDFDAAEKAAMQTLFNQFGLGECSSQMLEEYSQINKKYWEKLERGEMTKDQILVQRFVEFFEKEKIDSSVASKFNQEYQLALGDTIVVHDDAIEIIKKFKETYQIVIVTNGTAVAQKKKLEKLGLNILADYIFISEIVGAEKPNRQFFEKVISEVGIHDLKQALIIGDSLTSDIQGGYNSGIDTCWYNPKEVPNHTSLKPTYIIKNLHELEEII